MYSSTQFTGISGRADRFFMSLLLEISGALAMTAEMITFTPRSSQIIGQKACLCPGLGMADALENWRRRIRSKVIKLSTVTEVFRYHPVFVSAAISRSLPFHYSLSEFGFLL
jgi:hypothetical protein